MRIGIAILKNAIDTFLSNVPSGGGGGGSIQVPYAATTVSLGSYTVPVGYFAKIHPLINTSDPSGANFGYISINGSTYLCTDMGVDDNSGGYLDILHGGSNLHGIVLKSGDVVTGRFITLHLELYAI